MQSPPHGTRFCESARDAAAARRSTFFTPYRTAAASPAWRRS